jgi:hypothetical protein
MPAQDCSEIRLWAMTDIWRQHLAAFLIAQARHQEAARVMARAERTFFRLLKRGVDENRAYTIAGVNLADERSVRTYQDMKQAFDRLRVSCQNTATRLWANGAWLCGVLPRAANDRIPDCCAAVVRPRSAAFQ